MLLMKLLIRNHHNSEYIDFYSKKLNYIFDIFTAIQIVFVCRYWLFFLKTFRNIYLLSNSFHTFFPTANTRSIYQNHDHLHYQNNFHHRASASSDKDAQKSAIGTVCTGITIAARSFYLFLFILPPGLCLNV